MTKPALLLRPRQPRRPPPALPRRKLKLPESALLLKLKLLETASPTTLDGSLLGPHKSAHFALRKKGGHGKWPSFGR